MCYILESEKIRNSAKSGKITPLETHPGPLSLCVRYFPGDMYMYVVDFFLPLSVTIVKLVYVPPSLPLQFPFIYISQKYLWLALNF